jgi:hypothetical protein
MQPVSAAHTFDPVIFRSCLHVIFPALAAFIFRIFMYLLITNIRFYRFLSLHFVTWVCLQFRFLYPLTLYPLCFFKFSSILLASLVIKRFVILSINYFLGIFGFGLIFKSLEEVISSGEVSEDSMVLKNIQ